MISVNTFPSEIKTMSSIFMKRIYMYIFNIFYQLVQLEQRLLE